MYLVRQACKAYGLLGKILLGLNKNLYIQNDISEKDCLSGGLFPCYNNEHQGINTAGYRDRREKDENRTAG